MLHGVRPPSGPYWPSWSLHLPHERPARPGAIGPGKAMGVRTRNDHKTADPSFSVEAETNRKRWRGSLQGSAWLEGGRLGRRRRCGFGKPEGTSNTASHFADEVTEARGQGAGRRPQSSQVCNVAPGLLMPCMVPAACGPHVKSVLDSATRLSSQDACVPFSEISLGCTGVGRAQETARSGQQSRIHPFLARLLG